MARNIEYQIPSVTPDDTWYTSKAALLGRHHTRPESPKKPSGIYISNLEEATAGSLVNLIKNTHTPVKVRKNALRLRLELL